MARKRPQAAPRPKPTSTPSGQTAADVGRRTSGQTVQPPPNLQASPAKGNTTLVQGAPRPQPVIPSPMGPSAALPGPSPSDPSAATPDISVPTALINLELGRTGLAQYWGRVAEEFLPELSYERGRRVFREMADNDPTIGALISAIKLLLRAMTWRVESDVDTTKGRTKKGTRWKGDPRAEFIASNMDDMDHTWNDLIAEIVHGTIVWGWSLHELVYKLRQPNDSEFADGMIGWKKMPLRSQESLWRWDYDEDTQVLRGMFQRPPPDFVERYIPLEKSLLFRMEVTKGNPEGRSLLRNGYRPWYFKKYIEQIEAIGIERDLAGMPVIMAPAALFDANPPSNSAAILTALKKIAVNIRRDEQEGIVMPQLYDPDTKMPLYELKLLSAAGKRQFDTSQVITRWDTRLLLTVLVDFLIQGHDQIGSFAMHKSKVDFFNMALNAWADNLTATFNRYAVRRLLELNGMDTEDPPYLVHGSVERRDLDQLGTYLNKLALSGMPMFPNAKLENQLLEFADLPTMTPEEQAAREIQDDSDRQRQQDMKDAAVDAARLAAQPQGGSPGQRSNEGSRGAPTKAPSDKTRRPQPQFKSEEDAPMRDFHTHVHLPDSLKMPAPVVHVAAPEVHVQAAPAPEVFVPVTVKAAQAPDVHVDVHVPEQRAPDVHVTTAPVTVSGLEKIDSVAERIAEATKAQGSALQRALDALTAFLGKRRRTTFTRDKKTGQITVADSEERD